MIIRFFCNATSSSVWKKHSQLEDRVTKKPSHKNAFNGNIKKKFKDYELSNVGSKVHLVFCRSYSCHI